MAFPKSFKRFWVTVAVTVMAGFAFPGNRGLAADWPAWRGSLGNGVCLETNAPTRWSRQDNVRWRTPLPEGGNSTPIVWGDQIFITQNSGELRSLVALDRHTGKIRWSRGVKPAGTETTRDSNPFCASSPVTDGQRVVAWFGSAGLVAFDLDGGPLWRANLGRQRHPFGYSSSPVMDDHRVYLNFGPGISEYIVALDKHTGKVLWELTGPEIPNDDVYGTWSTPFLTSHEGQPQLLVALRDYFGAVDPATGREIWRCQGLGKQAKASPIAGEGIATISGDLRGAEIAVRLGGHGDVTQTHRIWRESPPRSRVGTGVIHRGHIYGARADGILDCVNLQTGDVVWAHRQPGAGANSAVWSCPVLVGEVLYITNQGGDTVLLKASTKFEVIAVNSLREKCNASPVIAYGDLFIRTWKQLWCIEQGD